MGVFKRLSPTQKSAFAAFLFTVAIALVFTLAMIALELVFEARGLPHICNISEAVECSLADAIFSRLGFFAILVLVFGTPVTLMGGLLGFFFDKIQKKL